MRETQFIEQNRKKWEALERLLEAPQADPDRLHDLFVQVTDDLSYARTFYPNRSVRVYLNGLAQKVFVNIYGSRKTERNKFLRFWTDELPQLVYESRRAFRLSFGVFALALLIGVLSSAMDAEFVRVILGDSYVDMTLENIQSGDPMAVYKTKGAFGMWLGITTNNLWVAFITFATGILYGVGTIWLLLRNGIMVGSFQYFFVEQGLFQESFLTIWMHGTLEISAIVIAGAAGLTMSRGLLFPGTFSRLKAFQLSARRGLKIMLGITPIFVLAGFIEGYLTRQTELPDFVRLIFILLCLGFVLGYFVWYPVYKARRGFTDKLNDTQLPPDTFRWIDFEGIKSVGQLFSEAIFLFKKYFKTISGFAVTGALIWAALSFWLATVQPSRLIEVGRVSSGMFHTLDDFFQNEYLAFLPLLNAIIFGGLVTLIYTIVARAAHSGTPQQWSRHVYNYSKCVVGTTCLAAIPYMQAGFSFILFITFFPILLVWMYVMVAENRGLFQSFSRTLSLISGDFWKMMGLFTVLIIMGLLFVLILDTTVFAIIKEVISMNIYITDTDRLENVTAIILSVIVLYLLQLVFAMLLFGMALLYYTLVEIREARVLKSQITQIGNFKPDI